MDGVYFMLNFNFFFEELALFGFLLKPHKFIWVRFVRFENCVGNRFFKFELGTVGGRFTLEDLFQRDFIGTQILNDGCLVVDILFTGLEYVEILEWFYFFIGIYIYLHYFYFFSVFGILLSIEVFLGRWEQFYWDLLNGENGRMGTVGNRRWWDLGDFAECVQLIYTKKYI
jgi:hypothetical protein